MNTLLLISIITGVASQNIAKKYYTQKAGNTGVYLLSALTTFFAMLFFIITTKTFRWVPGMLTYSALFAGSFLVATLFLTLAIECGSLSLTSLVTSYSLMLPTFYGIIFLKESVSVFLPVGIVILAVSLFLINKKNEAYTSTPRWVLYVFLAFLGNGMCSVFQKMQQVKFNGEYKNEFMIIALAVVTVFLFTVSLLKERTSLKSVMRHIWIPAGISGFMAGVVNLFVMILSESMSASIMFPLISAGGIIVTFLISLLVYKEKISKNQLCGFIMGVLAIIFLSI